MNYINHYRHLIYRQVSDALLEDIYFNKDWSTEFLDNKKVIATIKTNEDMILSGIEWVNITFAIINNNIKIDWFYKDGDFIPKNTSIFQVHGFANDILKAERTALNFLQTLSGVSTITKRYVDKVKDLNVLVMDTRKTIPGLRFAQKYAVLVGGGHNQRMGLFDGVLLKENHINAFNGIRSALEHNYKHVPLHIPIQIEVENIKQLEEAIEAKAKLILLDNMSIDMVKDCVKFTNKRAVLEASGGITLENIRNYALTNVDRISIGALTKDLKCIDLSMRIK